MEIDIAFWRKDNHATLAAAYFRKQNNGLIPGYLSNVSINLGHNDVSLVIRKVATRLTEFPSNNHTVTVVESFTNFARSNTLIRPVAFAVYEIVFGMR